MIKLYKPQPGDVVRFIGWTEEQVKWGNNDTPYMLIVDKTYVIESVETHSYHTKVTIQGVDSKMKFNSVHFDFVSNDNPISSSN